MKRDLEELCTLLEDALNTRLKTPPQFEALSKAFNDPEKWYNIERFMDHEQMQLLKEKVGNILIHVKGQFGHTFIPLVDEICTGYNLFLYQYVSTIVLGASSSSDRSVSLPMKDVYKQFYENYHQTNEVASH